MPAFFNMTEQIFWMIQETAGITADLSWLTNSEFERIQALRFEKRRQDRLSGRWVAKNLLKNVLADPRAFHLNEISIENEASGTPFALLNGNRMQGSLSISHRGSIAVAAYCGNPSLFVGIDLEQIEEKSPGFIEDYFTTEETTQVNNLPESQRAWAASLLWSGREAMLKAHQIGLRLDTRQIALKCPTFETGQEWQPLEITHQPAEMNQMDLFWRLMDQTIITLAIKQNHQALDVSPGSLIQIL